MENREAWQRNSFGVKDGADCYRTIGGVRWQWFAEDVPLFKAAGIRHRKGPGGAGTFVHPDDNDKAFAAIDAHIRATHPTKETPHGE